MRAKNGQGRVWLIHQDEPDAVETAVGILSQEGFAPRVVAAERLFEKSRGEEHADVMVVFARTYREKETFAILTRIRETPAWSGIPLLVAVSMYQMPLANRVKPMPRATYVFVPFRDNDLVDRIRSVWSEAPPAEDA